MQYLFNSSLGIKLSPEQIVREILNFIKADENMDYKVIIGTDSEADQDKTADFVTAIVAYRVVNGGRYFWRRIEDKQKFHPLRDRILNEVVMSLDVAKKVIDEFQKVGGLGKRTGFEIHIDVGENGATKVMMQELVGMIRANNFEVKTKPDSYAASKVADRHV